MVRWRQIALVAVSRDPLVRVSRYWRAGTFSIHTTPCKLCSKPPQERSSDLRSPWNQSPGIFLMSSFSRLCVCLRALTPFHGIVCNYVSTHAVRPGIALITRIVNWGDYNIRMREKDKYCDTLTYPHVQKSKRGGGWRRREIRV